LQAKNFGVPDRGKEQSGCRHQPVVADNGTRTTPSPRSWSRCSAHIKMFGTAPDGRIFQTAWAASHPRPVPVTARPPPLRPATRRVSLWLNAGVPATEVARRAGHDVTVLLKIYAHRIDGQADAANQRITDALSIQDTQPEPEPDDEGDDDSEQTS